MKPINEQLPEDFSNEDSLISDYLNGYLSESEKIAFEKRLLEDSNFAKEVEFQKELALAVRMQERQKLKKSLKEISLKNKATNISKPIAAIIVPAASKSVNVFGIAATITFVIVSSVSLMIYLNSNNDIVPSNSTLSKNVEPIINSKVDPTDSPEQIEQTNTDLKRNANKIQQEKSNESIASRVETKSLKVFPLKVSNDESFSFGSSSSKEIIVNIHRTIDSKSNNESQNAYMLWKNDLDIWIDSKQEIKLYNLLDNYVPFDSDLEVPSGIYCRIGNDFYRLSDVDMIQPLKKESEEIKRYLIYLSSRN